MTHLQQIVRSFVNESMPIGATGTAGVAEHPPPVGGLAVMRVAMKPVLVVGAHEAVMSVAALLLPFVLHVALS